MWRGASQFFEQCHFRWLVGLQIGRKGAEREQKGTGTEEFSVTSLRVGTRAYVSLKLNIFILTMNQMTLM